MHIPVRNQNDLKLCLCNFIKRKEFFVIRSQKNISGLIFGKKSTPRTDPVVQREIARAQLLNSIPASAILVAGPGLPLAVHNAFEIIQRPQLNKQVGRIELIPLLLGGKKKVLKNAGSGHRSFLSIRNKLFNESVWSWLIDLEND